MRWGDNPAPKSPGEHLRTAVKSVTVDEVFHF